MDLNNKKVKNEWSYVELKILMGFHNSGISVNDVFLTFSDRTEYSIRKKAYMMGIKIGCLK